MFFDALSKLLGDILNPQPRYITVTPVRDAASAQALPPSVLPRHVAIIMDGNGRWATSRGLPRSAGHAAGTEALRDIIRASDDWGIEALSLYAFSTENWSRSKEEVGALMGLLLKYFNSEIDELDEKNVKITILGDVDGMPGPQREALKSAVARTAENTGLRLNIALNYGGRAELVRAARLLAQEVRDGALEPEAIDEAAFAEKLYTAGLPDVDLLIRTSGEMRTSNFLPWQLVYAEMVFDDCYWPDFDRAKYLKCLRAYASRDRRFGGVKGQAPGGQAPETTPKEEAP
ncbi:MAG: isoprenyl transferase [Clostridia bacterium]|nr:isoprenyl transferase [Clostridia bacterium]